MPLPHVTCPVSLRRRLLRRAHVITVALVGARRTRGRPRADPLLVPGTGTGPAIGWHRRLLAAIDRGSRLGDGSAQVLAGGDAELAEHVAEVPLDGTGLINSRAAISGLVRPARAS